MGLIPTVSAEAKSAVPGFEELTHLLHRRDSLSPADLLPLINLMKKLGMRKVEIHEAALQSLFSVLLGSAIAVGTLLLWVLAVLVALAAAHLFVGVVALVVTGNAEVEWADSLIDALISLATCGLLLPGIFRLYERLRAGDPLDWKAHAVFWGIVAAGVGSMWGAWRIIESLSARLGEQAGWGDFLLSVVIGLFLIHIVSVVLDQYHSLCPAAADCVCQKLVHCRKLCRRTIAAVEHLTDSIQVEQGGAICKECLLRITLHDDDRVNLPYYQCRGCGKVFGGEGFLDHRHVLVAALDRRAAAAQQVVGRNIVVHVLQTEKLFDLDRVIVYDVAEEDLERYVIRLQNDGDEQRRGRYARATCVVNAARPLSGHAMSLLRGTFGEVQVREPPRQQERSARPVRPSET